MTKVVISGYYGFANAGDEALLTAIIGSLEDTIPDVSITVITGNCAMTRANHKVHAIHRFDLWGIIKALSQCHILISGGGSLLQDVTSARSLYYYLAIMQLALWLHKPVMLYAQGIGPVRRPRARQAVRRVLQRVAMIGVRDTESQAELAAMGVTKPPVVVTADAVLSMHPVDTKIGFYLLKQAGVTGIRRRIGIAVRNWQQLDTYKDVLAAAADRLQEAYDCHIIFVPMQYPVDVAAGEDIARRMKGTATVLRKSYNTVEFMSLMGCMDVVIANRLHALIFASLMGVPVTAISYDPKIDSFIRLIGESLCGTMESVTADAVISDVSRKLERGALTPEVEEHIHALRRKSMENAYLALHVLDTVETGEVSRKNLGDGK